MPSREIEHRLISPTDVSYDESGNASVSERIGDVEICNVPNSMRFVRPEDLEGEAKELLRGLLVNAQPHAKIPNDNLNEGAAFATSVSRGSTTSYIPEVLRIGTIVSEGGKPKVSGNVLISFHDYGSGFEPKLIGFEIDETSQTADIRGGEKYVWGTSLTDTQYQDILRTLQAIPKEATIPHPGTKEFMRHSAEFRKQAQIYEAAGLVENSGAIFKFEGKQTETEQEPLPTLVAVHPYYLEYHNSFGQRDTQTPQEREQLMSKYDSLLSQYHGPIVFVEEQNRVIETLERMKKIGRIEDTYFVITENTASSLFPYTTNQEFMDFLKRLGLEGIKFVGGHDAGNKPYESTEPSTGETITYSGCLRGLANRIEKRGFPKVETMPGHTYS